MRILAFYLGLHDSSVVLYDSNTNAFRYRKSERTYNIKRHRADLSFILDTCRFYRFDPDIVCLSDGNRNSLSACDPGHVIQDLPVEPPFSTRAKWYIVDHHLAHALSCWPILPSAEQDVGFVIDGRGDHERRISVFSSPARLSPPVFSTTDYRIGHLFDLIGEQVGFRGHVADHAGKLMGLQAYGLPNFDFVQHLLSQKIEYDLFSLVSDAHSNGVYFDAFSQPFRNWLSSIHFLIERLIFSIFTTYATPTDRISYSGGCALNSVINCALQTVFPNLFIPPHAYDGGLSFGIFETVRIFLGLPPIDCPGFPFLQDDEDFGYAGQSTLEDTASALMDGQIVGWLQGRGELGPRSLGHRSLLLNPALSNGKQLMNIVKKREPWRPFASSILSDYRFRYVHESFPLPYMLHAARLTEEGREGLRATAHIDGTCRVQTVDEYRFPDLSSFSSLIRVFGDSTGTYGVLNTSFNAGGYPLVSSRAGAIEFFEASPIDVLVIGDEIMRKSKGSQTRRTGHDKEGNMPASAEQEKRLFVFHPSPNLVPVVDNLIQSKNSGLKYENIIHEDLLNRAIANGITPDVVEEVSDVVQSMPTGDQNIMLCTCSTLGGIAEKIGADTNRLVVRIDRAMGEKAIDIGGKIGVAAALKSTIEPTVNLLNSLAAEKGTTASIKVIHCASAWEKKQAGDNDGYIKEVADCLRARLEEFDVIVLAQGSMAPAKELLGESPIPILSSPDMGVESVLKML